MKIGDKEIEDVYGYMKVLNSSEKGETVVVELNRKGKMVKIELNVLMEPPLCLAIE